MREHLGGKNIDYEPEHSSEASGKGWGDGGKVNAEG